MKNIEYSLMAPYYDQLYSKKDYKKEVDFILKFINSNNAKILDAGCGTGNHSKFLYDLGFDICGFDTNKEMVSIANTKVNNKFFIGNVLTYKTDERFDIIISFFAVFNHLKNYKEFAIALKNLKDSLNTNGKIIVDLHNPQKSGQKVDSINNINRIMKWNYYPIFKTETSRITYKIENKVYKTKHKFKIFNIDKIKKMSNRLGFKKVEFYENYNNKNVATKTSKNIQIVFYN